MSTVSDQRGMRQVGWAPFVGEDHTRFHQIETGEQAPDVLEGTERPRLGGGVVELSS